MENSVTVPRSPRLVQAWRRLEASSVGGGLAAGVLLGGLAGWLALYKPGGTLGLIVGVAALGIAVALAFLGRAVVVPLPEPTPAPLPGPEPLSVVEDVPGLPMVVLPGGEFLMGSPDEDDVADADERPQHAVQVSGLLMAQTPVTRALYREIMGKGPNEWAKDEQDDRLPTNYVSWGEAVRFCNALSKRQGLRPCYRRTLWRWRWDRSADGYRLPTEAEWEYAARAGSTTRWFFGDAEQDLGQYAWFSGNSGNEVHPVAEKWPNPWGLYDMLGNVWEWCWDWYGPYVATSESNPEGPATGTRRVARGGSAWNDPGDLRPAYRGRREPVARAVNQGFRCVRVPVRPP